MSIETKPKQTRMSASERRDEILEAAVAEFAERGLHGTSTETIAARAGVSQPYLFRLFGTKKGLFIAALCRGFDRVQAVFAAALEGDPAADSPEGAFHAMGEAYMRLMSGREELLLQLQAYASCSDPEVQQVVRDRYITLFQMVGERTGASEDEVLDFFARGMLLNIAAALDMASVMDVESWARRCLHVDQ